MSLHSESFFLFATFDISHIPILAAAHQANSFQGETFVVFSSSIQRAFSAVGNLKGQSGYGCSNETLATTTSQITSLVAILVLVAVSIIVAARKVVCFGELYVLPLSRFCHSAQAPHPLHCTYSSRRENPKFPNPSTDQGSNLCFWLR